MVDGYWCFGGVYCLHLQGQEGLLEPKDFNLNQHLEDFKSYTIVSLLHCSNSLFITTKLKSNEEF